MPIDVLARLALWLGENRAARTVRLARLSAGYVCYLRHDDTVAKPCTTTGQGSTLEAAADDALMQEEREAARLQAERDAQDRAFEDLQWPELEEVG